MGSSGWLHSGANSARHAPRNTDARAIVDRQRHHRSAVATVEFPTRGRPFQTDAATGRIWTSRCGRYRVRESRVGGSVVVYAQVLALGVWGIVSEHRKRSAAIKACQAHARRAGA